MQVTVSLPADLWRGLLSLLAVGSGLDAREAHTITAAIVAALADQAPQEASS